MFFGHHAISTLHKTNFKDPYTHIESFYTKLEISLRDSGVIGRLRGVSFISNWKVGDTNVTKLLQHTKQRKI